MTNIIRNVLNGLVALFLGVAFLAPYAGGAATAYVLIVLSLALILWNFVRPPRLAIDLGSWMMVFAWSAIAIGFALTNLPGRTDFLFAFNFSMFALYPMLSGALQRFAGPNNSAHVAVLALAGSFVALALAAFQVFIQHLHRAQGFGSNPIPSATVALFLGFFALLGLFAVKGPRRYFFLLGPVAGVATVLLAGSRGPLIALPALALVAVIMLPIRRAVVVGAVVVAIVAAGAVYAVKPAAFGRIHTLPTIIAELITGKSVDRKLDRSANIRYRILEGSLAAFKESPWLGYGWYMKVPVVAQHLKEPVGFGAPREAHLHSDLLNMGVSAGIVGLLAYVLVLLGPIVSALASPHDRQRQGRLFLTLTLGAGYVCCGAVNLLFGFEFMTTMYICFAAIFVGYCRDTPAARSDPA